MKFTRRDLFLSAATAAAAKGSVGSIGAAIDPMPGRRFSGEALREIAFPLGGIGTGTVSLGGYGNLMDWEIFNRPAKGSLIPFTFACLRMEGGGLEKPLIRVLERQPLPPYNYSHGVPRETSQGLPRFRKATFVGAYPFAQLHLSDARLPIAVTLEAFNPMVPLDSDASGLPVAVLEYHFASRASSSLNLAAAFSMLNPIGYEAATLVRRRRAQYFGQNLNEFRRERGYAGIFMSSGKYAADSPRHGTFAILSDDGDLSYRLEWEHGRWWDELQKWWDEFEQKGRFPNNSTKPSGDGLSEYATLASHFALEPGESKTVRFILSWHFPNLENYWSRDQKLRGTPLRNHYGTRW
ncbi:MAG: hypothetical protein GY953_53835, partial [bacterium]|nr:hypothetical protein [bacterium]